MSKPRTVEEAINWRLADIICQLEWCVQMKAEIQAAIEDAERLPLEDKSRVQRRLLYAVQVWANENNRLICLLGLDEAEAARVTRAVTDADDA